MTPWVDCEEESNVNLVYVDGTQDEEAIVKTSKLEEPLHFNTILTGIVVGHDVKDYPTPWGTFVSVYVTLRLHSKGWSCMSSLICYLNL